jgi:glycine/D-amino acid oxidase-like deaminating enzyme
VVLVDERPPLSLTSDKSAECYRNWWPGPGDAMVSLMNRSIDLLEEIARESGNAIRLNRRGYLFATAEADRVPLLLQASRDASAHGAGPLRIHSGTADAYEPAAAEGFEGGPGGVDVIVEPALVRRHFPYLAEDTVAVVHARRGGWFSGQQLGNAGRARGGRAAREVSVSAWTPRGPGAVTVRAPGAAIITPRFVTRPGHSSPSAGCWGDIPVFSAPREGVVRGPPRGAARRAPRHLDDPVRLPWSAEERRDLADSPEHRRLLDEFAAGVHGRPEGGGDSPMVLLIWTYDVEPVEPTYPIRVDPAYPEILLRGMSRVIPALAAYLPRMPRLVVDGGYYTKTRENRLLAGPLPVDGAYVIGGLSGYGLMSSNGAADLLADHIAGRPLPRYAPAFSLARYDDPAYCALVDRWGDSGQL